MRLRIKGEAREKTQKIEPKGKDQDRRRKEKNGSEEKVTPEPEPENEEKLVKVNHVQDQGTEILGEDEQDNTNEFVNDPQDPFLQGKIEEETLPLKPNEEVQRENLTEEPTDLNNSNDIAVQKSVVVIGEGEEGIPRRSSQQVRS